MTQHSTPTLMTIPAERREFIEDDLSALVVEAWKTEGGEALVEHAMVTAITQAMLAPSACTFAEVEREGISQSASGVLFGAMVGFYMALTWEDGQDNQEWIKRALAVADYGLEEVPADLRKDAARIALERLARV